MVGTVSAARRERRGVSPRGRGRGRSGAVGGGRDRIGVSRGDPARSARGKRGDGRGRAGVPRRCPREPRKCLLRRTRRDQIARGGSGGHASRRTISGSARSMCREVPLWYPRARDGAATVCSMARARLPKARVGASDESRNGSYKTSVPDGCCARGVSLVSFPRKRLFYSSIAHDRRRNASSSRQSVHGS